MGGQIMNCPSRIREKSGEQMSEYKYRTVNGKKVPEHRAVVEELRRRVERASSHAELREIVDSLVGSAPGHPPYQL